MQMVKRKSNEGDTSPPKKKKVRIVKSEKNPKEKKTLKNTAEKVVKANKNVKKEDNKKLKKGEKENFKKDGSKNFKKDGNKGAKSFKKPSNAKGVNGDPKAKGKPGFNKDKKFAKGNDTNEKPKWAEMKKEKKQLRIVRRKAKSTSGVFEISLKAKMLAAQIQRKQVKPNLRLISCKELHTLLKGQYKSIALTHDLSRVIQVLLKHCPADIKTEITEELLSIMVPMAQSKYAHHSVKRILKYGTDFIRHEVIRKLYGHIVSLATHAVSAPVLDYAYGEFASKKEKIYMQQEFYGDLYKNAKDDKVKSLSDAYKGSPEMKPAILLSCKAHIQKILNKNLHDGELFHSVLYDYLVECSTEDRAELISALSGLLVPLSNSLPGVNAASLCVWQGSNKDKKTILKVVKEHAVALSKHKTGYRLLLTIFDAVDDTVLVKKAIVATLASNLQEVAKDHWGNMTLHWLIKPRDPVAFHPSLIKFFENGSKTGTSKKDVEIRVAELREAIWPAITKSIQENAQFWLSSKTTMLLVVAVLSIESSKEILSALAQVVSNPDWMIGQEGKEVLAIEDAGIHMCLKKLATLDKDSNYTFGEALCNYMGEETLMKWLATNRGCFFLVKLIENSETTFIKLSRKIKPYVNVLKLQTSEGAKILLHNLKK